MVEYLSAMPETRVQSLGWEDSLKGMATHSRILAWRLAQTEEAGRLESMGSHRVRQASPLKLTYKIARATQQI